jgi:hypothetical protein
MLEAVSVRDDDDVRITIVWAGGVAQVVECLHCKREGVSSNPSPRCVDPGDAALHRHFLFLCIVFLKLRRQISCLASTFFRTPVRSTEETH